MVLVPHKQTISSRLLDRRTLLAGLMAGGAIGGVGLVPTLGYASANPARHHLRRTPGQTAGPFYPESWSHAHDGDLLVHPQQGGAPQAMPQGSVFLLTGVVMRQNGTVLPNSLVELWQADGFGRYAHRLDQNTHDQSTHDQRAQARDPHFAGFGRVLTNAQGRFTFRTLKPAPYPGRTQHVHIRVVHPQAGTLTTQLYFPANPNNARDFLFSRLTRADQEALLLHWTTPQSATPPIAHCRLVV